MTTQQGTYRLEIVRCVCALHDGPAIIIATGASKMYAAPAAQINVTNKGLGHIVPSTKNTTEKTQYKKLKTQ